MPQTQNRGDAAREAKNLFFHLTYGDVKPSSIEDAAVRSSTEEQILQFGQMPVQILREPHPARFSQPIQPDQQEQVPQPQAQSPRRWPRLSPTRSLKRLSARLRGRRGSGKGGGVHDDQG